MFKGLQRLNILAIWLLAGVLASILVARIWPEAGPLARSVATAEEAERTWPGTLQVHPSHAGDPVTLVKIMKDGKELLPGKYRMPEIAGSGSQDVDGLDEWLSDFSVTLKNITSKNIVSMGVGVVLYGRETGVECNAINGHRDVRDPWCDAHPHYCDGGCPVLIQRTLHWGLIPGVTASGLEARYARYRSEGKQRFLLEGRGPLRVSQGEEITLSPPGRVDGIGTVTDPRHPFSNNLTQFLYGEGIEEAEGAEPCANRVNSKSGCAFAEVPKFNVGIDLVYFEDGTIWGNYGYGYALPNPDGIFTRVVAHDFPGTVGPVCAPN